MPFVLLLFFTSLLGCGAVHASGHDSVHQKVFCGYQGWFRAEGDGSGLGWVHYGPGKRFAPGTCSIDLWPDLSDFPPEERYPSPFRFEDGTTAELFSNLNPATVDRHFQWMRQYGIDGAFLQRFATELALPKVAAAMNTVLNHCTAAADTHARSLTVMYDLSGLAPEHFQRVSDDWRQLVEAGQTRHPCAQHHDGKPLIALWGLGFRDRAPGFSEWKTLLESFRSMGCSVMVGVPAFWRELKGDAVPDMELHQLLKLADIISPWTVGRCSKPENTAAFAQKTWRPDIAWCAAAGKVYLPVIFPGFSWHNLSALRGQEAPVNQIPRRGGDLLWRQAVEAKKAGANALYIAMFDEIDEGTAIMKCGGRTPSGESQFADLSDVASDHYLWLSGQSGRLLRGEIEPSDQQPPRGSEALGQ